MLTYQKCIVTLGTLGIVILSAALYQKMAPKTFAVMARVVVHRSAIEATGLSTEASKNRWIWVRDGYAIKDSLVSQHFLVSLLTRSFILNERYEAFRESTKLAIGKTGQMSEDDIKLHFVENLKEQISVDYLGGDAFTYVVVVKDRSGSVAKHLVKELVDHLRFLVVDETREEYQAALLNLMREARKKSRGEHREFLMDTYRGLLAASLLFEASATKLVEVVQAPAFPLEPIWPRFDRLLFFAVVLGLALALMIQILLTVRRSHRLQEV